jgi:hypothetical protein
MLEKKEKFDNSALLKNQDPESALWIKFLLDVL